MKCIDDCHTYALDKFNVVGNYEFLRFYRMSPDGTTEPGTTNEEVIKALIHRLTYLNEVWMDGKFECVENYEAIKALEDALNALEARTRNREARKVEGTNKP